LLKARDISYRMREKISGPLPLTEDVKPLRAARESSGEHTGVKTPVMTLDKEVGMQHSDVRLRVDLCRRKEKNNS
jgi:hypothetical protein